MKNIIEQNTLPSAMPTFYAQSEAKEDFREVEFAIGESNFESTIKKKNRYIDKSLLIKDIIDDQSKIKLIIRPRRFGKTLNLSMLDAFFHRSKDNKAYLFHHLKIWKAGERYQREQGQYPVIFLTFKDIKSTSFEEAYEEFKEELSQQYAKYDVLLSGDILKNHEKIIYQKIIKKEANKVDVKKSLKNLSRYLQEYYGNPAIILIDEYDTPIHASYIYNNKKNKYYDKMTEFMRSFLSSALKDNPCLNQAILFGILRVAKESIFSGLNNIRVYSVLSYQYAEYFGFTKNEVHALLENLGNESLLATLEARYGNYQIGSSKIFNPWSLTNFIKDDLYSNQKHFSRYWVNTSDNKLIEKLLKIINKETKEIFKQLLMGKSITQKIIEHTAMKDIDNSNHALWSFLLLSGYLTFKNRAESSINNHLHYELLIPNIELLGYYQELAEKYWFAGETITYTKTSMLHYSISRYSDINTTLLITEENWVISFMRLTNSQHVFLVLEGIEEEKSSIYFFDLVATGTNNLFTGIGKVRMHKYSGNINEKLLNKSQVPLMRIYEGDKIISQSWVIQQKQVEKLLIEIEKDQKRTIDYHIFGKNNITTWGGFKDGHNCLSWTKEKLNAINDDHITIESDILRWIKSNGSSFLKDPSISDWLPTSSTIRPLDNPYNPKDYWIWNQCQKPLTILAIIAIILSVAIALNFGSEETAENKSNIFKPGRG